MAGPGFGSFEIKRVLVVRALYGLNSSGAAWRAHLVQTMSDIGFRPCVADPDIGMKPGIKIMEIKTFNMSSFTLIIFWWVRRTLIL
jgi:hypothetical protein